MADLETLTTDGLNFSETSDPSTPAAGKLRVYGKTTGLFYITDGGTVVGPLAAASAGSAGDSAVYTRNSTNYSTNSTSFVDVDNTNTNLSLDTGANRVMVTLCACANLSAAGLVFMDLLVDTVSVSGGEGIVCVEPASGQNHNVGFTWITDVLTAANHTFELQWKVSTGTATMFAGDGGVNIFQFAAHELA